MIVKCHFFFVLWIPWQFTEPLCEFHDNSQNRSVNSKEFKKIQSKKIQNNKRGRPILELFHSLPTHLIVDLTLSLERSPLVDAQTPLICICKTRIDWFLIRFSKPNYCLWATTLRSTAIRSLHLHRNIVTTSAASSKTNNNKIKVITLSTTAIVRICLFLFSFDMVIFHVVYGCCKKFFILTWSKFILNMSVYYHITTEVWLHTWNLTDKFEKMILITVRTINLYNIKIRTYSHCIQM
jgi:TfoX/Sxy family transcriptional regulator of competence genes